MAAALSTLSSVLNFQRRTSGSGRLAVATPACWPSPRGRGQSAARQGTGRKSTPTRSSDKPRDMPSLLSAWPPRGRLSACPAAAPRSFDVHGHDVGPLLDVARRVLRVGADRQ